MNYDDKFTLELLNFKNPNNFTFFIKKIIIKYWFF